MIDPPRDIVLAAHEACAIFPVVASKCRERLWYPGLGQPVPYTAEVLVLHPPSAAFKAQCFAETLRENGYRNVILEQEEERFEFGEIVA